MESARRTAQEENMIGVASGMTVQELGDDDAEDDDNIEVPTKKVPARKTKQERRKAEKLRAEVRPLSPAKVPLLTYPQKRMLAEKMAQKRMLASVPAAKALRKQTLKTVREREAVLLEQYEKRMQEQLKNGLAGKRLGKHIVPEHNIDVQLGEDLSESLRQLKPEGNLFKDRFLSMQQRALIEPRSLVLCVFIVVVASRMLTNSLPGRSAGQKSRSTKSTLGSGSNDQLELAFGVCVHVQLHSFYALSCHPNRVTETIRLLSLC